MSSHAGTGLGSALTSQVAVSDLCVGLVSPNDRDFLQTTSISSSIIGIDLNLHGEVLFLSASMADLPK